MRKSLYIFRIVDDNACYFVLYICHCWLWGMTGFPKAVFISNQWEHWQKLLNHHFYDKNNYPHTRVSLIFIVSFWLFKSLVTATTTASPLFCCRQRGDVHRARPAHRLRHGGDRMLALGQLLVPGARAPDDDRIASPHQGGEDPYGGHRAVDRAAGGARHSDCVVGLSNRFRPSSR